MLYYCIARLQPVAGLIYSVYYVQLMLMLLYDSLHLVVSGIKLSTVAVP